jgi:DNA-binding beta-propeller fold protein YncE
MICRPFSALLPVLLVAAAVSPTASGDRDRADAPATDRPGPLGGGVTLLPNGWKIAPVGRHLDVGDLPLAMALHPDGRQLVITNNGWSKPSLRVVDLERYEVVQKMPLDDAWLGLVWHPDGRRLFSSGAQDNSVREIEWRGGRLVLGRTLALAPPQRKVADDRLENAGFVGGLALSSDGRTLYAAQVYGESLAAVDVETGRVLARAVLPAEGYTTLVSPDDRTVLVSVWGAARIALFEPLTLRPLGEIAVGEHPNAMALSPDGGRLFVACANTNAVWAIDLVARKAVEQIGVALRPGAPPGSTPNALALSPDGSTLMVADADNNAIAVVDVRRPGESRPLGFIPSGWYPTGVAFDPSGRNVFVLSGKGLTPVANPRGPQSAATDEDAQYIASLLGGALSMLPRPDEADLGQMTRRVYSLNATGEGEGRPSTPPEGSPIPGPAGPPSPIKHVFYVIRENRTYDQVFGDVPQGNGDPNLTLFGEDVTPNAHALSREFVLFDNFYVDAEVSHDGHSYSTAAYATDANEKLWPTLYGDRGGLYLAEGGYRQRNPYGNIDAPARGYLWDFANRAGVSVRSYGEFATRDDKSGLVRASVPGLEGKVHPSYAPFDLSIPDKQRVDAWLEEFRRFEKDGELPRLNILHLGNDHTEGTRPGRPTPRAFVAENDVALGRVVEAISKSRFWPESAIFVLEDDAQNGPDHVDAHRSVLLVASPWTRRAAVDSTLYTTSGVVRTIELILGLPPMSQYDEAATPLHAAFVSKPDARPYAARPARIDLDERNRQDAPGAEASLRMNLDEFDRAPERELNEILWKSVRGAASVMPPPVRAAFVRPLPDGDDGNRDDEP